MSEPAAASGRDELLELVPGVAAGEGSPEDRARVLAAAAQDPELAAELAAYESLEELLGGSLGTLLPEEGEELVPLAAGGDLSPAERGRVAAATEHDPLLASELDRYRRLDRLLSRSLGATVAGAGESTPGSLKVKVQCPFCHDAVTPADRVRCQECETPHHAACFGLHGRCAVHGCGGAQVLPNVAAPSRACPACEATTPADAPFCAYCGERLTPVVEVVVREVVGSGKPTAAAELAISVREHSPPPPPGPAREVAARRRQRRSSRLLTAAASTLVVAAGGLGLGAGQLHRSGLEERLAGWSRAATWPDELQAVPRALVELAAAQDEFRRDDLDRDGRQDFAADVAELQAGLAGRRLGSRPYPALAALLASELYELELIGSELAPTRRCGGLVRQRAAADFPDTENLALFGDETGTVSLVWLTDDDRTPINPTTCRPRLDERIDPLSDPDRQLLAVMAEHREELLELRRSGLVTRISRGSFALRLHLAPGADPEELRTRLGDLEARLATSSFLVLPRSLPSVNGLPVSLSLELIPANSARPGQPGLEAWPEGA